MIQPIQFMMICNIKKQIFCLIDIVFISYRFEWSAPLVDIRRQHIYLSVKNNSPLFAQEQTYMGDVRINE